MAKFYITTSIPYANAAPHIGFALEAIQTDVIARFHRQKGEDVFFLTGTDEHGTKIQRTARDVLVSPQKYVDGIAVKFQELAKVLNISNTDFIRTSDQKRHWPAVREVWQKLQANGDIIKKQYEGLYCSGCEGFLTPTDLVDGKCPYHQKAPELVKEENYFFTLSKYADRLREILEKGQICVVPDYRKNEVMELIRQGLEDVSFSRPRTTLEWGIPVPGDETQVIYVWADALTNYISALGYPDGENFKKYWPVDVHVVGKDIVRFHSLVWPAMLLSLGLELPRTLFVHGFITVNGQKMSKSLGNAISPFELVEKYGTDAVRYFFVSELPATEDGDFSYEKFEKRYQGDLANGIGNLVNRVLTLASEISLSTGRNSILSSGLPLNDTSLNKLVKDIELSRNISLGLFDFLGAINEIWKLVAYCNVYINDKKPWLDSPNGWKEGKGKDVIDDLVFVIIRIAYLIEPFMPKTATRIREQIKTQVIEPLFPRLEKK
ncbi:MAG: methionine--tRNA ligase [Candidatus Wildermuthbacteria bacterium RIFCSPHIGHO2_12_FULL_45_9]|nr:MAG: methionine--tRNA ligase [Candidatus Wildermuthbacteria bacterium RIFCSPHIGHO2_12_FULL_45_9]